MGVGGGGELLTPFDPFSTWMRVPVISLLKSSNSVVLRHLQLAMPTGVDVPEVSRLKNMLIGFNILGLQNDLSYFLPREIMNKGYIFKYVSRLNKQFVVWNWE